MIRGEGGVKVPDCRSGVWDREPTLTYDPVDEDWVLTGTADGALPVASAYSTVLS